MNVMDLPSATTAKRSRRPLTALVRGLALLWAASAVGAPAQADTAAAAPPGGSAATPDSVAVVQCLTASAPAERSATFSAEMSMIPGAAHMSMRIEVLERMPGDTGYHPVLAPGLGVW